MIQKPWSVSWRGQEKAINPSDRGTMHSSLQMVQTLNLLPFGVTLSSSANQKIKAPCQNKRERLTLSFLIFSLVILKTQLLNSLFYCLHMFQHQLETPSPCASPRAHRITALKGWGVLGSFLRWGVLGSFSLSWWQWQIIRASNVVVRTRSITP